ncbi:MAG: SPOR domain-containing protein [Methyloceanibacter sp.]
MALRRKGSRNWARGVFATFWILLAGASGLYLFSAFSDPTLGGQLVKFAPAGETTGTFGSRDRELTEIKASLRELTQQMAALTARLDPDAMTAEPLPPKPLAEAEPAATMEAPAPDLATTEPPAAVPSDEPSASQADDPSIAAAEPPGAEPVEQAALDAAPPAPAAPQAAPEPEPELYEPPSVVVAPFDPPLEDEPAAATEAPTPTIADVVEDAETPVASPQDPPAPVESAALDPIALPSAANDGSTRFGIEIGTVAKQDGLRPLWREFLTNHAALVAGLQPRRVLAPDKSWRLIAGPFGSAAEAAQACALFKKASRPCEATVYAGDSL